LFWGGFIVLWLFQSAFYVIDNNEDGAPENDAFEVETTDEITISG